MTAEELIKNKLYTTQDGEPIDVHDSINSVKEVMIEFAKYHVEQALLKVANRKLNEEAKELDLPELPPFEDKSMLSLLDKDIPSVFSSLIGRESEDYNEGHRNSWIKGYKAAQQSNKQFSLEDMLDVFEYGLSKPEFQLTRKLKEDFEKFIQSLSTQQLPKEFIPELIQDFSNRSCSNCNLNIAKGKCEEGLEKKCVTATGNEEHGDYWISCLTNEEDAEIYKLKQ